MAPAVHGEALHEPLAARGAVEDDGSTRMFVYERRRPMHSGRFMDFAARHFGALEHQLGHSEPSRWRCSRRRRAAGTEERSSLVLLAEGAAEAGEAWSADWVVHKAGGCVWLAGSDDRQADWSMQTAAGGVIASNRLLLGQSWPVPEEPELLGEAGERRIELRFELREQDPTNNPPHLREPSLVAEKRLRKALEACLLSRSEAAALEQGDFRVLEGLGGFRPDCVPGAPASAQQLPRPFRAVQGIANVISEVPGSTSLANLGYALARATSRLLGGGLDGPGHCADDEGCGPPLSADAADEPPRGRCLPCTQ